MRLRIDGVTNRKVGNETIILDHQGGQYLTVSGSGTLLFDLLRDERDQDQLVAALVTAFDVDEETARRDVKEFIEGLSAAGLLSTV